MVGKHETFYYCQDSGKYAPEPKWVLANLLRSPLYTVEVTLVTVGFVFTPLV